MKQHTIIKGTPSSSASRLATGSLHAAPRAPRLGAAGRRTMIVAAEGSKERQPWEFGRFVNTFLFFNPPPPPQKVLENLMKAPLRLLGGAAGLEGLEGRKDAVATLLDPGATTVRQAEAPAALPKEGVVLVTGATGGVGKRVVSLLLQQGRWVRALVRSPEAAAKALSDLPRGPGARLELVQGDLGVPGGLPEGMGKGVRAVIHAASARVQPKEGDTADRAKYKQGIVFYEPEVVSSPEAIEYKGMERLIEAVGPSLGFAGGGAVYGPDAGSGPTLQFGALDDVVMGGASLSNFTETPGAGEGGQAAGVFSGRVTTANSGGFASVRSRNAVPPFDLGAYEGLEVRVKGDGQRYKFILRCEEGWDTVSFCRSFDTKAGEWTTVRIPWDEFIPVFRARTLTGPTAPRFDPSKLFSIQIMLSKFEYDGGVNPSFREGNFSLTIGRIAGYLSDKAAPRFVLVGSAGVTRTTRPGIDLEKQPPAVRMNDMLGGLLTFKLKGEDVVRASGVPYAIVRPVALTEEPRGAPLQIGQGDEITGKVPREDIAALCVALLDTPAARDTSFEVKSTIPFSTPFVPEPGQAPTNYKQVVTEAALRPAVTGRTVNGQYLGLSEDPEFAGKAPGGKAAR